MNRFPDAPGKLRRPIVRMCPIIAAILLLSGAGFVEAEPAATEWADLVDPTAQSFEDPFRDLTYDQLSRLRTLVRLRDRLASSAAADEARTQLKARLSEAEASLEADGINPDWLISQRWIVAERRRKALQSGNPSFDGREVRLVGFAIPAPPDKDGSRTAYLVAERGLCSHMPPPPPNQMVRVRLDGDWSPNMMHEPVILTGRLHISPSERSFPVVDGFVAMAATFTMDLETVEARPRASPKSDDWVPGVVDRFFAAGEIGSGNAGDKRR